MTGVQTLRRPEVAIFDFHGLIGDPGTLHCKAFRKVLDPPGVRFS
jgi:beta-phosphoglucomutase-like phosphatase (HAD superfamily)